MRFNAAALGCLLACGVSGSALAASTPHSSRFDRHMQVVSYNAENVDNVYVADGYLTQLIFGPDEHIVSQRTGFEAGWELQRTDAKPNVLFINDRAVQQADAAGAKVSFKPAPGEWDTNLLVSTNKHDYVFNLHLLKPGAHGAAYQVRFDYPGDRALAQAEQAQKAIAVQAAFQQKQAIKTAFKEAEAAKNWDYGMIVGKGSQSITPDFAYDNGALTYLGFLPGKNFPAPFIYNNGAEQIADFNVEQHGNYKVMVLHGLSPNFILRYGQEVVGIVNQAAGRERLTANSTIAQDVERTEVSHGQP